MVVTLIRSVPDTLAPKGAFVFTQINNQYIIYLVITGATLLLVGILIGLYIPTPHKELIKGSFNNAIHYKKKATVIDMTEAYDPEKENEIYPTS